MTAVSDRFALRMRTLSDDPERGSVSIWVITTVLTMMLLLGLGVDLSGQVRAKERAQDIAVEAARAGGQQLDGAAALRGDGVQLDATAAVNAANTYLAAAADVTGTATVTADHAVVVDTSTTYATTFLSIIGIDSLTVTGHAEARPVRAVGGAER